MGGGKVGECYRRRRHQHLRYAVPGRAVGGHVVFDTVLGSLDAAASVGAFGEAIDWNVCKFASSDGWGKYVFSRNGK